MDEPTPEAAAPAAAAPVAPAVVAVVVAHDPGDWFEEALQALADQDYPNLEILVIDAASEVEIKPRVGRAAPGAFVRRLADNPGFGSAANEVLEVVEGAAFYLICHDDIAPARDAVRLLVEEAFRSNAAVVGPKLVRWDDPRRLLQLGEGVDHAGYVSALVERDELDQEQHDSVRDVFNVPGACTLVRADLFEAIGGFDEGIDYLYDDVSMCWRAQLAGGRVVVAPQARVRHLEALGQRRPDDDRRRLQGRHRLRVVLSCYSVWGLVRTLPKVVVLHLAELVYSLLVGRTGQARDLVASWMWNLRRTGELLAARKQVKGFRRVKDSDIRAQMTRGSSRLQQFFRGQIGTGDDRLSGLARSGRGMAETLRSSSLKWAAITWGIVALVLVAGSRHLLTRGVPAVGEMVPFSVTPFELVREWVAGWRTAGLGSESPNPTLFGVIGGLGTLFLGAMGLLRTVLTVGLIPIGALFAYRLPAPTGSRPAQIAALIVYVSNPLPYNALSHGRWSALVLYAAAPMLLNLLARLGDLAPYGAAGGTLGRGLRAIPFRHAVLALGLTTAIAATVVPVVVVVVVVMALALAVGSLLTYHVAGSARLLGGALAAAVVAVALHLPWSLELILPGTPLSAITGPSPAPVDPDLGALLRFNIGPLGSGVLGWAFLVAAALPLLIGRDERHAWAVRGWTLAIAFWGLAWAAQRGHLPVPLPSVDLLLAPSAIGLALASAMGVVAFEVDLPGYRFGWRQIASGVAALAVAALTIPVIGASFDGRWSMPRGDHSRALRFIDDENDDIPFRVLWLGNPAAIPLGTWEIEEGLAYGTTDHGSPRVIDLLVGSDEGRTALIADMVQLARSGQTARLGRLLAPMGIRYVAVPEQLAPAPFAAETLEVPEGLGATLDAQLDLEPLDLPAGLRVYRNQAFFSPISAVPAGTELPATPADAVSSDLTGAVPALPSTEGPIRWQGPVEADTSILFANAHSPRWELTVDGTKAEQGKPYGWANSFQIPADGEGDLRFRTPIVRYLVLALQGLAWLWVARTLLKVRVNSRRRELTEA